MPEEHLPRAAVAVSTGADLEVEGAVDAVLLSSAVWRVSRGRKEREDAVDVLDVSEVGGHFGRRRLELGCRVVALVPSGEEEEEDKEGGPVGVRCTPTNARGRERDE